MLACALLGCRGSSAETTVTTDPTTLATPTNTSSTTTTTTSATTSTSVTGTPSPINGMLVGDSALLARRAVAIKIDNHVAARPQSGLEQAEAVYELLVEGGITRFIAVFHTTDPDFVGPMRSARPTDIGLIKPMGATFFVSGMQPWVRGLYREADIYLLEDTRPAAFRIEQRRAPHNLYADTGLVREAADRRGYPDEPPPALFAWGDVTADSEVAETITFDWSSGHQISWQWDGSQYLRFTGSEPHNWVTLDFETEQQLAADTLVVLKGERYTARPSGSGTPVPATETVGTGEALVFWGGRVAAGTWSRDTISETFTLMTGDGTILAVPPGRLWIVVFPDDRRLTWS